MHSLIATLKTAYSRKYQNLSLRWSWLLSHYQPANDREIREILTIFKAMVKKDDWLYTERLADYLNIQLRYQLAVIWTLLKSAPVSIEAIAEAQQIMHGVALHLHAAREELAELKGSMNCLSWRDYEMELEFFRSIIEQPLAESEVRFGIRQFYPEEKLEFKSFIPGDPEHDTIDITPLEVDADDILGQHGLVMGFPNGYVAIGDWYFPLIETEDNRIGLQIERFLADLGGCPRGYIYDPAGQEFSGYNYQDKRCQCSCRTFCRGGELLFAWTPQALAAKLREVKTQIGLYGLAVLGFDKKLLENKTSR